MIVRVLFIVFLLCSQCVLIMGSKSSGGGGCKEKGAIFHTNLSLLDVSPPPCPCPPPPSACPSSVEPSLYPPPPLLVLGNRPTTRETHAVTSQTTHICCVCVCTSRCPDACARVLSVVCGIRQYDPLTLVCTPPPPSSTVFPNATISVTITITITPSPFLVVSCPFTRYILGRRCTAW